MREEAQYNKVVDSDKNIDIKRFSSDSNNSNTKRNFDRTLIVPKFRPSFAQSDLSSSREFEDHSQIVGEVYRKNTTEIYQCDDEQQFCKKITIAITIICSALIICG